MNLRLLISILLLHSVLLTASQTPADLKTQLVAKAAVGKLKDLKATRETAKPQKRIGVAKALLTMGALSVVAGTPSAAGQIIPAGLTRYPIYDVSAPDCIPLDFYPNMLCMRTEDFNRNMSEALDSVAAVDDFYRAFMAGFVSHVYTEEEANYYFDLIHEYPNEGFVSQEGSQFKSIALARYPGLCNNSDFQTIYTNNNLEYYQWRQTRNQTSPYQPNFVNGTLAYGSPHRQWKTLLWLPNGAYESNPEKEKKAFQLQQKQQDSMKKKVDNSKKQLQRSNQTARASKRQPKFNGSRRGK